MLCAAVVDVGLLAFCGFTSVCMTAYSMPCNEGMHSVVEHTYCKAACTLKNQCTTCRGLSQECQMQKRQNETAHLAVLPLAKLLGRETSL
eukprot:1159186-Pelagomonas_calceolata.AAC.5